MNHIMKRLLLLFLLFAGLSVSAHADMMKSLTGKRFQLDKEKTQAYLLEHELMPEEAVKKMDSYMASFAVTWKVNSIIAESENGDVELKILRRMEKDGKLHVVVEDPHKGELESIIVLTENGYYQEVPEVFKGYRDYFVEAPKKNAE